MEQFRTASVQSRNLLALMLSKRGRWLHGYELSELTALKSGSLYPILMRLSDRGVLEAKWEPSPHPGRPPRRLYRLTAQGVSYAIDQTSEAGAPGRLCSRG